MGMFPGIGLLALLLLVSPLAVCGSKVLILAPLGSLSHKNYYVSIAKALTQAKHQVTLVSGFKPTVSVRNMEEVVVPGAELNLPDHMEGGYAAYFLDNAHQNMDICFSTLESKRAQKLFNKKYDLVILSTFFAECYFSLIHGLQVPFVYASPYGSSPELDIIMGSPTFPSFLSSYGNDNQTELSFTQRLSNTVQLTTFQMALRNHITRTDSECRSRGICSDNMPHIMYMRLNSSLTLINSMSRYVELARPEVPTVVHAGGIDLYPPKPLPQPLEDWAEMAEFEGVVYFSLGRDIKPSKINENDRKEILNALSRLDTNIFAKWDTDFILYKPRNILIKQWLPQQSLLGDPRTMLFISSGGKQSTDEAAYHGVPILGLPITDQQISNMHHVEEQGLGRSVSFTNFSLKDFRDAFDYLINDQSVQEAVRRRSSLLQDVPANRGKAVVYWLEYVLRHEGAKHLRCPAINMQWYRLYNVDVWSTVAVILVAWTLLSLMCLRGCIRRCSRLVSRKEKVQ
ncbi:unnamed protein product [Meganyctiphanes norvegica]|uniref:UDP-glucuronosyltransferase n=1 Tax=Meganyctiphanes norvegica TaxID=48144 RepID=A0AAV2RXS3_MEGNR